VPAKGDKKKWHSRLVKDKQIVSNQQLEDKIAKKSSLTSGNVHTVTGNLMPTQCQLLLESHSVWLDGPGTFPLIVSCKGKKMNTPEKAVLQQINCTRCRFTLEYTRTTFTGNTRHLYNGSASSLSIIGSLVAS